MIDGVCRVNGGFGLTWTYAKGYVRSICKWQTRKKKKRGDAYSSENRRIHNMNRKERRVSWHTIVTMLYTVLNNLINAIYIDAGLGHIRQIPIKK